MAPRPLPTSPRTCAVFGCDPPAKSVVGFVLIGVSSRLVAKRGGSEVQRQASKVGPSHPRRRSGRGPLLSVPRLVVLTGPIAAGKNATAEALMRRASRRGLTVVLVDLDDVAAMVGSPGAAAAGLWFAAHQAHGALVGQWARSHADLIVAVGPIYTVEERAALVANLPDAVLAEYVVIDAPVALTLERALADPSRGLSRNPEFHYAAHARFRALLPGFPRHLLLDSSTADEESIAQAIERALGL